MEKRHAGRLKTFCLVAVLPLAAALPSQAQEKSSPPAGRASIPAPATNAGEPRLLNWDTLLPEKDRASSRAQPPAPVHDYLGEDAPGATQTGSAEVNKAVDGLIVKLPGYLVPLAVNDKGEVNEFLLVPYFGACIHVPPPPPNQIVYIKSARGIAMNAIYEAYWITGKIRTQTKSSRLGSAAYAMEPDEIELYTAAH